MDTNCLCTEQLSARCRKKQATARKRSLPGPSARLKIDAYPSTTAAAEATAIGLATRDLARNLVLALSVSSMSHPSSCSYKLP